MYDGEGARVDVKEEGVGNQVIDAVVVHCAMQHRVRKGNSGCMAAVLPTLSDLIIHVWSHLTRSASPCNIQQ
jgi:hypothetical protein